MSGRQKGSWFTSLSITRRLIPITLTACFLIPTASLSYAMDAEYMDEVDFLSEVPIVTSATRLNQKITDVPASITIIDSELIEASGATEIPQLFRLVPGYLSYYVLGNQFGVTNRGLTLEYPGDLEVMIDGRSVYESVFSAVEWSSLGISIKDIDYIEVVRGSNAPTYGSNAFLGAINIVTLNPVKSSRTSFHTTVGDLQTRNAQLRHSGSIGNLNFSTSINYRHNEGFPRLSGQEDPGPFDRMDDSNEATHLVVKGIYSPSLYNTLEFQLGVGESTLHIPDGDASGDQKGFNKREMENNFQLLRWVHNQPNNNQIHLQLYHNRLEVSELRELGPLSAILGVPPEFIPFIFDGHPDEDITTGLEDTLSERYDLEFQQKLNLAEKQRFVWGLGVRYDRMQGEFLLSRDDTVDEIQYRLFANWEWCFHENWTANIGAMAEHNSIIGDLVSPRAAVNYTFSPNHTFHASYTYGNRTPSILEANQFQGVRFADGTLIEADVIFGSDIDESTVEEVEVGYMGSLFNGKLSIDVRLFRTEADQIIGEYIDEFPDLTGDISVIGNTMDWTTKGLDTQIKLRPNERSLISLQYAYTDYQGDRLKRIYPYIENRKLNVEIPRHNANLLLSHKFDHGWQASFVWYYLSDVNWRQGHDIRAHDRLDFRLAKNFHVGGNQLKAELIAHNLLNDYPEFHVSNHFETRVFLRIGVELP